MCRGTRGTAALLPFVALLALAVSSAAAPDRPPQLVLATTSIGRDSWRLVAAEGIGKPPHPPCFGVGLRVTPGSPFFFASTSSCPIPAFSGPVDASGKRERRVIGFIFPKNVVRVRLDLGEAGERSAELHLISSAEARKIHVERFRWGLVKVLGPSSLEGAVGYNAAGNVVYEGAEGEER